MATEIATYLQKWLKAKILAKTPLTYKYGKHDVTKVLKLLYMQGIRFLPVKLYRFSPLFDLCAAAAIEIATC